MSNQTVHGDLFVEGNISLGPANAAELVIAVEPSRPDAGSQKKGLKLSLVGGGASENSGDVDILGGPLPKNGGNNYGAVGIGLKHTSSITIGSRPKKASEGSRPDPEAMKNLWMLATENIRIYCGPGGREPSKVAFDPESINLAARNVNISNGVLAIRITPSEVIISSGDQRLLRIGAEGVGFNGIDPRPPARLSNGSVEERIDAIETGLRALGLFR